MNDTSKPVHIIDVEAAKELWASAEQELKAHGGANPKLVIVEPSSREAMLAELAHELKDGRVLIVDDMPKPLDEAETRALQARAFNELRDKLVGRFVNEVAGGRRGTKRRPREGIFAMSMRLQGELE